MSALANYLARPRPVKPRYIIDPVAFFAALIGGPLLFTAATFWLFFVPVFALAFGAIPYLVIGTPALLFYMIGHPARPLKLAQLALFCLFSLTAMVAIGTIIMDAEAVFGLVWFYLLFGAIFAPGWAACFGWIYGKLRRDFFAHPLHP